MAIDRFIQGNTYKWVGPSDFSENWNSRMDAWKDGKPRICVGVGVGVGGRASFADIGTCYYGHCLKHFIEVGGSSITKRPTVGDKVRIISDKCGAKRKGKIGIIRRDDKDGSPYKISIDGMPEHESYYRECDIEFATGVFIQSRSQRRREILGRLTIE